MTRVGIHSSNNPEDWVYDISRLSQNYARGILNNINAEKKEILTPCEVLVMPHPGQEKFLRYILASIFKRVPSPKAKNILAKYNSLKEYSFTKEA